MQVYKIGIPEIAVGPIVSKLKSLLYIGPTLWLVTGGSNTKTAVMVMERLDSDLSSGLTIALTDERFGPRNHKDSNWRQLMEAGFDAKNAKLIEVLSDTSDSLEQATKRYNDQLEAALEEASSSVGLFGMGADGHIAGILPESPAANDSIKELVFGYQSNPYTRITISFEAIRRLNQAFLVVFGPDKLAALTKLTNEDLALSEQPAQVIKQLSEAYLYNDQLEGKQQV